MKKSLHLFFLVTFISLTAIAQVEKEIVTKKDYERAVQFLGDNTDALVYRKYVSPTWLDNENFWYQVSTNNGEEYVLVNAKEGSRQIANSLESLLAGTKLGNKINNTTHTSSEMVSPDGKKVAFIKDWNLWMRNLETGKETQLTTNGIENYGYATDNAGWRKSDKPILLWSPDSKKIATYRQDQRHVSDMYLVTTNVGAPELRKWKYPLPQDEKVIQIERVIIDTENKEVLKLNIEPDPRRGTLCDDISCSGSFDDNEWSNDSTRLYFVSTSRDHKSAKLRMANASTGEVKEIFEEKVATQYESGQDKINWSYLDASNEIIWYSERDDYGHLYLYNAETGKLKNQITKGKFVVTQVSYIDEEEKEIYFMANGKNKEENPYFSHLYKIDLSGKNLKNLTPEKGTHSIHWSPDHEYFVDNYSTPTKPNIAVLRNSDVKLITQLEEENIQALKENGWKAPEEFTVRSANGEWDLYGLMFTPTNLDKTKKYPIINYIYPGPQGGSIRGWSFKTSRRDHQALAELGFVVFVLEGTCNPGREKSFHDACYGSLSENTLPDQISGIKQLSKKYSFMDTSRIGVWGHSGGGSATVAAMFKYPDFYQVGIAESGNHDNRNYEDVWGERYIGLMGEDPDSTSAYIYDANAQYAENLKGKLMLIHGAMDDNVPPYHTYLVVDALIKANKDFDLIVLPHARHSYGDDSYYVMRRRWDYFVENLKGATPPENFKIDLKK
ncbi:dipeptidyl aminopeptidase/acylaminoacyl peptidase [Christiangramia gaetbulicola]|uniref:Dipeptidyl aminopeptidase/acylaminoacyl peptidase n=1 Tax=Christiangramia gaetbulicola TaxID=703340 RepID=A0A2T6AGR3_9FLAO|nr:S9 family peptidase [Christiangramia gaetbulicola]PTX42972.1 dipeptidyl aminopeptidase/acylaminoacyl peptidase [Christiangramia gaetbulicola]